MADSNVEALTALLASATVDTDLIYIWDIGESGIARSKKMTVAELKLLAAAATATDSAEGVVELSTPAEAAAATADRVPPVTVLPVLHQDNKYVFAADGEASDTYVITLTPAPAAYATGQVFYFTANTANTGAATLNVNGLGAKTIVKRGASTLANGDIAAGQAVVVIYDGTDFQMLSQLGNAPAGSGDMVLADVQTVTGAKTFGTIGGAVGKFILAGSTSGSSILNASAVAGSTTHTLPPASGILALIEQFKTEYISAGAMVPNTTNGATTATFETATNDHEFDFFGFIGITTNQVLSFDWAMPDDWDLGTIKVKFYTTPASGSSSGDDYTFEIKAVAVSDDDAMDVAYGTGQHIDQVVTAGVDADLHISAATAAITVGGSPALEDLTQFKITRLQDDAADNMPEDARLRGIAIQYKTLTTAVAEW